METIILIEDDPLITQPVEKALIGSGFSVQVAHNGKSGLELALASDVSVVILDIMLPEMDGWEVCKAIRAESVVPILMLTALGNEVDRILGLELGADDYLTKPFSTRELIARIKALLRRVNFDQASQVSRDEINSGPLMLDMQSRRVYLNGTELTLRYKEFELLSLLVANQGDVVTRADIFDQVWGTDWLGDTRTLDVHIRWLREKVEDDPGKPHLIQTVRGVGYRFVNEG